MLVFTSSGQLCSVNSTINGRTLLHRLSLFYLPRPSERPILQPRAQTISTYPVPTPTIFFLFFSSTYIFLLLYILLFLPLLCLPSALTPLFFPLTVAIDFSFANVPFPGKTEMDASYIDIYLSLDELNVCLCVCVSVRVSERMFVYICGCVCVSLFFLYLHVRFYVSSHNCSSLVRLWHTDMSFIPISAWSDARMA